MLWSLLVLLTLARAVLAFAPGMWFWGLDAQRFLPPLAAWLPWMLAALALAPPCAAALTPLMEDVGQFLEHRRGLAMLTLALGVAALVWVLPDRNSFVGDSLIRSGAVTVGESPEVLSPQAFPLDVFLHYTLPRALRGLAHLDPQDAQRVVGAMGAGVLGALAVLFARALGTGGARAAAALAVILFGGYLGVFTGDGKAFAEMSLAAVGAAGFGLRAAREGRGLLGLGVTLALALVLHRSAVVLIPAWVLAWGFWWRSPHAASAWRRPVTLAALLIPIVAMVFMLPRIASTAIGYDLTHHFLSSSRTGSSGALSSTFAGLRLLDLANALLRLSPLILAVPALLVTLGARAVRTREGAMLLTLATPFALMTLLTQPQQGLIRDWDTVAMTGAVLAAVTAWLVARSLASGGASWLTVAVALGVAAPSVQWLLLEHDAIGASARVRALMVEPPPRSSVERAFGWTFLGWRAFAESDWRAASDAFSHAADEAPSARMLTQWAMAEQMQQHYSEARTLFKRAAARDSNLTLAWFGVAVSAIAFNDLEDCASAAQKLSRLAPENPKTREILQYLAQHRSTSGRP